MVVSIWHCESGSFALQNIRFYRAKPTLLERQTIGFTVRSPCSIERLYHQQFAHRPHTTILINVSQNIFHLCGRKKRKLLQLLACCLIQVNGVRCQAAQQIVIFLIHQPLLFLRNHQLIIQPLPTRFSCAFATKENKAKIHTKTQFLIL